MICQFIRTQKRRETNAVKQCYKNEKSVFKISLKRSVVEMIWTLDISFVR